MCLYLAWLKAWWGSLLAHLAPNNPNLDSVEQSQWQTAYEFMKEKPGSGAEGHSRAKSYLRPQGICKVLGR